MAKRKGKGKPTVLEIEFHLRVKKPQRVNLTAAAIREMITWWVETGEDPGGVEILSVTWERNGIKKRAPGNDDLETVREKMLKRCIQHLPLKVDLEK